MSAVGEIKERKSARERLLAAADALFYEHGLQAVGIDRLIAAAGVAKASLYATFGSKEELIRVYLLERGAERRTRILSRMAQFNTAPEKILSVFALLAESAALPGYRGCAFARARAESFRSGAIKSACDESRAWLRVQFADLARQVSAPEPQRLAQQLALLYDGAALEAHVDGDLAAPAIAQGMAAKLLAALP